MGVFTRSRMAVAAAVSTLCVSSPLFAGPGGPAATPVAALDARVRAAVTEAVRTRMGDEAEVSVEQMQVTGEPASPFLQAVPAPNARLGGRVHFRLLGADGRGDAARVVGSASALITVDVEHVRVRALVPRGRQLGDGDIEASRDRLVDVPLRRLPRLDEVAGTRTLVNLAPGEIVAHSAVTVRPAVKSGQRVRATARVGGLTVVAALVAVQDGTPGAIIRVVNKDSRRELRARVVGPGVVEVIP